MKNLRNARRFLTANQIDKSGLSDDEIISTAIAHGWTPPEPATTPDHVNAPQPEATTMTAPAPTTTPDQAAALAALIQTLTPPAPPTLDEQAIKAAVEKYATQTLIIKKPAKREPVKITGAHPKLATVTARLNAGYKVYMFGPAGAGKTTLAKQAAEALELPFYYTGALLQKYELTGFMDAAGEYVSTTFYQAYKYGGLYLFDEIDASHPQAVIAFNAAIENGVMTFPNEVVEQHPDFRVIAAANTNGQGATQNYKRNALDGATLDRFASIRLDYDTKLETRLALAEYKALGGTDESQVQDWLTTVRTARKAAEKARIDVIISPRSSINGAGLLALGEPVADVIDATFGACLSDDQRKQLGV